MDVVVREFQDADAAGATAVLRPLLRGFLMNEELLLHWRHGDPPAARNATWVAEHEGEIVAWSQGRFDWSAGEDLAEVWVGVAPDSRRQGIGGRMYDLGERHVLGHGARRLSTYVADHEEAGHRFAERRGFRKTRRERLSALDPRAADLSELDSLAAARAAEGLRVVPLRDLLDRRRELHALYAEAAADVPADEPHEHLGFDDWVQEGLGNPLLDADASMNVLDGDRPVAFAWMLVDRGGGVAEHEMTGTLRSHRGRGLARLAKLAVLRWCADNGVTEVLTGNDGANAAMLAINDRLGYRETYWWDEYSRDV